MIDTSKEWVLCAAIWYKDGTEAPRGMIAQNISSGVVIGQWRHGNCINVRATNPLWNAKKLADRLGEDKEMLKTYEDTKKYFEEVDGFITSEGRFVDRWQAMELAYNAGQVDEERAKRNDYTGQVFTSKEFQAQEPHYRHRDVDTNGWNMMYSEDIY
jgi:hypothetical protein